MLEPSDHHGPTQTPKSDYPNETMRLLLERASLRSFTNEKIPPDILQLILDAGNHAATAGNLQPYSIIKIESKETCKWLAESCGQGFIAQAPVNLIFCIDMHRNRRWAELEVAPYTAHHSFGQFWMALQDTIMAAQNICTAADALGLGSVYIGSVGFQMDVKEKLKLPEGVCPVVLLCLGYPKNVPEPRKKLGVDVLVHNETYREMTDEELLAAYERKYENSPFQITEQRLALLEQVCREAHSEEFAQKCIEHVKSVGAIRQAVYYFGLHYLANQMPMHNLEALKNMEDFGFYWMKEFKA